MEEDITGISIEKIMSLVGYGKFQVRFILFSFCLCMFITFFNFSTHQVMAVPDHWCHVPRPPTLSNMSALDWKILTIPKKNNSYNDKFENCYMYNLTNSSLEGPDSNGIIKCQDGWEYDKTWFTSTIPSQEDWVCDQELRRVNFLHFLILSEISGQIFLGYLGDKYGRRRMYLISLTILATGRIAAILLSHIYPAFVVFTMISSFPIVAVTNTVSVVGMELSSPSARSKFALWLYLGHIFGLIISSLLYWAMRSWFSFYSTVCGTVLIGLILSQRLLVESPRWLISRRKIDECLKELKNICKYNGTKFSEEITHVLRLNSKTTVPEGKKRRADNIMTWKMTRLFFLMFLGWSATVLTNSMIFFNIINIEGNPHLNYIFLVMSEIPGFLVGKYLSDIIGRRFTRSICGIFITLGSLVVVFIVKDAELLVKLSWMFIKVFSTGVTFVTHFHTIEVLPASIRQTGLAASIAFGALVGSFSPRIIYLGRLYDKRIPYMVSISLGILEVVVAILMPETLGRSLPETVADTENLMEEEKFWAIPKKRENGI